ncbi:sigma-70 family RNA polymerase sigma factor [Streptomyces sp. NPDC050418]|uniref:sigma-70 family RNA polymerase sigma factor n=1 Tax=Streptomyces sp. NPDC050418 TaxID=3365612 RepID=UPI003788B413
MGVSREGGALVIAAQHGDRRAQAELVTAYLPLVYSIVGRAMNGHADVDDVVQDTMLRALRGIGRLQDPLRFRAWLVAIAMNQIRGHHQARQSAPDAFGVRDELDMPDPAGDFVNVTIVRLGLEGQRREVAEATRWLESDDRELLSLWWLEAAGELTRSELAAALEIPAQHAAVRVQRMKEQLETARVVVRALSAPHCHGLGAVVGIWDGVPSGLWRKRIARHIRQCQDCSRHAADLWPAEGLLVGFGLVPLLGGTGAGVFAALGLYGDPAAETVAFAAQAPGAYDRMDPAGQAGHADWADDSTTVGSPSGPTRMEERQLRQRRRRRTTAAAAAVVLLVSGVTAIGIDLLTPDAENDKVQATTASDGDTPADAESTTTSEKPSATPSKSKSAKASPSKKPSKTAKPKPSSPAPQPTKSKTTAPKPPAQAPANPGGTHAEQVLALVNTERAKAGCAPVKLDSRLSKAAQLHSEDMSANDYFSHTSQDGRSFVDRAKAQGVDNPGAENIAKGQGSAQSVMDAWMNSEGHRANILNCGLKTMGLGVTTNDWTWTQMFGW